MISPFSVVTKVGTRPERAIGYDPAKFSPAKNPGRVETIPTIPDSSASTERRTFSPSPANTTTSPDTRVSLEGNISAKS